MQSTSERAAKEPRIKRQLPSVAVIGLGYVGLPLAVLAAKRGHHVLGYDIDAKKIRALTKRHAPFLSPEEQEDLKRVPIDFSSDEATLSGVDTYLVCVPTPVHGNHLPDLRPLKAASEAVGRNLSEGALVIIESTVSPGVCENAALPALEKTSGLRAGVDFHFAHCPERINPGDERWDTRTIPRVIGGLTRTCLWRAMSFYDRVADASLHPMRTIKEAEAVKMVENAFRDVNIAFVNELAMSFDRAGIDLHRVLEGAGTKPFGFVKYAPGCGVGGHCIPVDPYYLIRYGRENGFEHHFLQTARKINGGMPRYTVGLLERALDGCNRELKGAEVALLGLSYKKGIADLRESPALDIRKELQRAGANLRVFDPHVPDQSTVGTLEEALSGADVAVIATDHKEFSSLSPYDFLEHGIEIVIDGRNCLNKEAFLAEGIIYRGIGRAIL